jgi:hypothetical protein
MTSPLEMNVPEHAGALADGSARVGAIADEVGAAPGGVSKSGSALDALTARGKRELDGAKRNKDKAREGVEKVGEADDSAAGDVLAGLGGTAAPAAPGGVAAPSPMAQMGQSFGQAAQQAAMMPMTMAPQMMGGMNGMSPMGMGGMGSPMGGGGGYQPGTVFLTPAQMAQLASSGGGGGGGRSNPMSAVTKAWNGSTSPDPLDVSQVAYEKTHGKMSASQVDAVIESAMEKTGVPAEARPKWKAVLTYMAEHESGFDPSAVNTSDSNAVGPTQTDGAPQRSSRGAWQTIPTTFAANHAAGTSNNIYDPEASAGAAINYMVSRGYAQKDGSGLDEFMARRSGGYVGY